MCGDGSPLARCKRAPCDPAPPRPCEEAVTCVDNYCLGVGGCSAEWFTASGQLACS